MASSSSEGFVVPRTYTELQRQYGTYIHKLLNRSNKVERNFEDLHSHIWVKILEARVLERFEDYVARQVPKVLNAIQACDVLGISWKQWSTAMCTYHKGIPAKLDEEGHVVERRQGRWMPTPINIEEFKARGIEGYASKQALFSFFDVIQLTLEERVNGVLRKPFRVMGRMIDSEGMVIAEERPEGDVKIPEVRVTQSQFRNYLTMAVLNHYANFCRTMKRRHKERPHTPHAQQEDTTHWEATLPDTAHSSQDTMVELTEARQLLQETLEECLEDVPDCRPALEHEAEIFGKLQEGQSLLQALKEAALPPRVRKAVLSTLRMDF